MKSPGTHVLKTLVAYCLIDPAVSGDCTVHKTELFSFLQRRWQNLSEEIRRSAL